ncbi:MAG: tetratricopeptide repeat protein [Kiloniellaceae bacterium]
MTSRFLTRVLPILAALALGGCADLLRALAPASEGQIRAEDTPYEGGKRHLAAGRLGLAANDFREALDEDPGSIEALNGLGVAYDRMGRHDQAVRAYARALALDPGSAQTLNNMGYSYLLQDRFDLAVAFLRDAYARRRGDPVIAGNRRVAEVALARAGGPRPARDAAAPAPAEPETHARFKPRIERTARGVQTLVTRPPPVPALAEVAEADPLPGFLASPMALTDARGMPLRRAGGLPQQTGRREAEAVP